MTKNKTQFIITLTKLPTGYAFHSLEEPHLLPPKKKIVAKPKPKNSTPRTFNHRIARELAIDLQPPSEPLLSIPEEADIPPKPLPIQPEEEISVDIKRQTGLPDCPADWFDAEVVHHIEEQGLPQFFSGRGYKTPQLYIKYRNFMVTAYRRNPHQYLTKIACRRVLQGDATAIMRVHSFLEKVGLINFGISKDGDYSFITSIFHMALNPTQQLGGTASKLPEADEDRTADLVDNSNLSNTFVNKCFSKSYRVFCALCQSFCGIFWYQRKSETDRDDKSLCQDCWQELSEADRDRYTKTDIIKRAEGANSKDSKPSVWSIDDNINLLEFVSKSQGSWEQLQNEVMENKKSFDEIMLQFMQFPITNFSHEQDCPPSELLTDPLQAHVDKLVSRLEGSSPLQAEPIAPKHEFSDGMNRVFQKLCSKYETRIHALTLESNLIESSLFEMKAAAAPIRRAKILEEKTERFRPGRDSEESDSEEQPSASSKNDAEYEGEEMEEDDQVLREFNFNYS